MWPASYARFRFDALRPRVARSGNTFVISPTLGAAGGPFGRPRDPRGLAAQRAGAAVPTAVVIEASLWFEDPAAGSFRAAALAGGTLAGTIAVAP